jgi:hypothetical protein
VNVSIHPIIVRGNTTNILAVAFSGLATHWYAPASRSSSGWYHGPSQSRLSQFAIVEC